MIAGFHACAKTPSHLLYTPTASSMAPGNGTMGKIEKIETDFFAPCFQRVRARNLAPERRKREACAEIIHFPIRATDPLRPRGMTKTPSGDLLVPICSNSIIQVTSLADRFFATNWRELPYTLRRPSRIIGPGDSIPASPLGQLPSSPPSGHNRDQPAGILRVARFIATDMSGIPRSRSVPIAERLDKQHLV